MKGKQPLVGDGKDHHFPHTHCKVVFNEPSPSTCALEVTKCRVHLYTCTCTVAANIKLTSRFVSTIVSCNSTIVFTPFLDSAQVRKRSQPSFLCTCAYLIGRRDCTANYKFFVHHV